jgi:hypothetical protein
LDIAIVDLMEMDIRLNELTLKLAITTTWTDPRLSFLNLKANSRQHNQV